MLFLKTLLPLLLLSLPTSSKGSIRTVLSDGTLEINSIPFSTRAHWMRKANSALLEAGTPCAFSAFATVIVNHSNPGPDGLGTLVCSGINQNSKLGNPTLHGEIVAITNCSNILTDPSGPFKFTPSQAQTAFTSLSLYTNAESCPMCASAIRWSGFAEYIYGSTIQTLIRQGWGQIRISSQEVFRETFDLPHQTRLIGRVLTNETDPFFGWQFNTSAPCPDGCKRSSSGTSCIAS